MTIKKLLGRVWPLALILGATIGGWFFLSHLALEARVKEAGEIVKGPVTEDYRQATVWATELIGLAGTFAGFLGVAAATQHLGLTSTDRELSAEGGIIGILVGATLLGVGDWPIPIALVALATGAATVRVVRALRRE